MKFRLILGLFLLCFALDLTGQSNAKKWYDSFSIRGYAQIRYNRLFETNPLLKCEQRDRSWGKNGGFFIRRMRVIFSGNLSDNVYFYLQPDFASSVSANALNFGQIRDAYMDIAVDKKSAFRFRIGQSKIPYGFENMQSSQNRLPLDRADATNSSFSNERDLGVFAYWASPKKRQLLARLVSEGLKGSGDYGILGVGVFNGQAANRPEANQTPHVVARVSLPMEWKSQIIEAGIQAYRGQCVLGADQISTGVKTTANRSYADRRIAASLVLYAKPWGIQSEYNWGQGPEFDKASSSIQEKPLEGGYVLVSYQKIMGQKRLIPFLRYQYYKGGKKHELDARSHQVKETELGMEYQMNRNFELVAMYTWSTRQFEDFRLPNNRQSGQLLRLQAQLNF